MSIKICFVGLGDLPVLSRAHNHHGIGGEQVQHTLLAKALARRGYDVSMIVGDYGQADGETFDGIKTFCAYREGTGLPGFRLVYPKCTGLWSAAKRAAADIYYLSCADMHIGAMAMYAERNHARTVFRVASDSDCRPEALILSRDKFGIRYWTYRQLYQYGLRNTNAVLTQTEWQRQEMRNVFGVKSTIARMLVEGPYSGPPFAARDIQALWVANLRTIKRPDRVLELARSSKSIVWHMIGGPQPHFEAMYSDIEEQAKQLDNLTFHGQVPYHDVAAYYRRARIFINTSDVEGFPNSFLQAWAAGTPVVTFFDPDGVVAKNRLGFAVSDLEQMSAAVERLLHDRELWEEHSARCLDYMHRMYSEDDILEPYVETFRQVLNG